MNILVINGHPDPSPERLAAALAKAYAEGAETAGHQVRRIDIGAVVHRTGWRVDLAGGVDAGTNRGPGCAGHRAGTDSGIL